MAATLGGRPAGGRRRRGQPHAPRCRRCRPTSPGRNPADLAREIGVDRAVKLASNEVAFPPLPAVVQALAAAAGETNRYPDNGAVVLTRGAGRPLRRRPRAGGHRLRRGHALPGARPGLQRPGHEPRVRLALVRDVPAARPGRRGAGRSRCRSSPAGPAARPTPTTSTALAAAIDDTTRLVFVCNPNNPTGTAVRRAELERFLDAVPAQTLVVLDEAYREFVTDPDVPDGIELMRGRPNVAVLRTFSKAWGLAGLRVGYLIAEDPAVAEAVRKTHVPFSVSMLAQAAAVAALASEDEVRARCAAVVAERDRLTAALRERGARRRRQPGQLRLAAAGRGTAAAGRRARGARGHHPAVRRRGHPGHRRHPGGGRRLPRRARRRAARRRS